MLEVFQYVKGEGNNGVEVMTEQQSARNFGGKAVEHSAEQLLVGEWISHQHDDDDDDVKHESSVKECQQRCRVVDSCFHNFIVSPCSPHSPVFGQFASQKVDRELISSTLNH
jgi:hypothetical protein